MTAKPRKRAIAKARKRLFIHYKRTFPKEFQGLVDALVIFGEIFNEAMKSRKEIEE
ncbi:hypothetical protein IR117_02215 [Streptococcus danieliae]|nr:hypothetical protein [Streptococcus danieliae]